MRGISLPVNAIIVIALGLLVLVVGASIVVRGGGGFSRTISSQMSIQECQALCAQVQQQVIMIDAGTCDNLNSLISSVISNYQTKCGSTMPCYLETADGLKCKIDDKGVSTA